MGERETYMLRFAAGVAVVSGLAMMAIDPSLVSVSGLAIVSMLVNLAIGKRPEIEEGWLLGRLELGSFGQKQISRRAVVTGI
ncbi:MAG TPA: hypothetical protein VGG60_04245 [Candidatus Binataceae bacterium]